MGVDRRVNTQDISWFLDLFMNKQLNLDPPYQRRSVWNKKDKQFFLDTIFNNFPCPAFYLQKDSTSLRSQYDVVDGKQRLQAILDFYNNKLALPDYISDENLKNKKWTDIERNEDYRRMFFDYVVTVEQLNSITGNQWNDVFYRLNKNAKTLTPQELRHAMYDGWFINFVEKDVQDPFWERLRISTVSKARRMKDVEYVSILLLVILEKKIVGYPQTSLDALYDKYDAVADTTEEDSFFQDVNSYGRPRIDEGTENSNISSRADEGTDIDPVDEHIALIEDDPIDVDYFEFELNRIKTYINIMLYNSDFLKEDKVFGRKRTNNLFSLWTYLALSDQRDIPEDPIVLNKILEEFFKKYQDLETRGIMSSEAVDDPKEKCVADYINNNSGASTEAKNRDLRLLSLQEFVKLWQA